MVTTVLRKSHLGSQMKSGLDGTRIYPRRTEGGGPNRMSSHGLLLDLEF